MTKEEKVILVDEFDNVLGLAPKLQAHEDGLLHRAFSVFIFNDKGQVLLQKRADDKYHTPGLWSNACCSHPRIDETVERAAHRRLKEEMGFSTTLREEFSFIYQVEFENGLTEHELDHVLVGYYNDDPVPNPDEVSDFQWVDVTSVMEHFKSKLTSFTPWFAIAMTKWYQHQQLEKAS